MAHRRLVIRERITAIIGAAILFGLAALSYYYSIQVGLLGLKYIPSESSPDFTAERVSLTEFDERGAAERKVFAASVAHFSDERMRADNVRFVTLAPDRPQLSLSADEAWSNDGLETVDLHGSVLISRAAAPGEAALSMRTEYAKGYLDTHRFETDRPVSMSRGSDTTDATGGMLYDNVAHTVELRGRVRTVLHPQNFKETAPSGSQP